MSSMVLDRVLPLAKRHIGGRLHDPGASLLRMFKMLIDVRDRYMNVTGYLISRRRSERASLSAKHDGTVSDRELRVTNDPVTFMTKAF
jgi:hypothetical protein